VVGLWVVLVLYIIFDEMFIIAAHLKRNCAQHLVDEAHNSATDHDELGDI